MHFNQGEPNSYFCIYKFYKMLSTYKLANIFVIYYIT